MPQDFTTFFPAAFDDSRHPYDYQVRLSNAPAKATVGSNSGDKRVSSKINAIGRRRQFWNVISNNYHATQLQRSHDLLVVGKRLHEKLTPNIKKEGTLKCAETFLPMAAIS